MRRVKEEIKRKYGDRFIVGTMSVQGLVFKEGDRAEAFLDKAARLIWETFKKDLPESPKDWESFSSLFDSVKGIFDRPVILFIDEFDSLPSIVIDRLVTLFRDMYLKRDSYLLHGLALIGVRAVLGAESERGSPFNVQRSLHIPNFTKAEVFDLFGQYMEECGQKVEADVKEKVYESTRGQPGLVCWFGELLTEKYNPGNDEVIDGKAWRRVYNKALSKEWNNTLLNLIKKAKGKYESNVVNLFAKSDIEFNLRAEWCNYLYLTGAIKS